MNYNDKIMSQQTMILNTDQNQFYEHQCLNESDQNNKPLMRTKQPKQFFKNIISNKGKENQTHNINISNNKNILTNHSFNGFFNQNTNNKVYKKNNIKQSVQSQNFDPSELFKHKSQLQININSPTNFNSSGKLSNLQFVVVNDSINKSQQMMVMNSQVMNFMKKYFPLNFQAGNYYGQYVTIQDFVEILLQDFQHLLGQNTFNLVEEFADKVFGIFGQKVYFEDLIEKASGNGLTGIVFQILKAIQQDKKPKKQLIIKQNKSLLKSNSPSQFIKDSRLQKSKQNSLVFNNMFKSKLIPNSNPQPLIMDRSNLTKISLDKFFGNSNISKVQFYQESTCGFQQQNVEQIKQILEDYIQNMYEDAQLKLNKKFAQQMKKISIKYKDTEKILEKVNQKVSNYYDCLQLEKDFQKKFKIMAEKQTEYQRKIKTLQYQLKVSKEETEKQKLNTFKTNQQLQKIKQKMQKYQNAIFQKAMKNSSSSLQISNTNNSNANSCIGIASKDIITTTNEYPSYNQTTNSTISQKIIQNPPKFQIRVDTFTEHRTDLSPHRGGLSPIKTSIPTYTSYFTKQSLSPINIKRPANQAERGGSVSPIKQRISFVKTQNPTTQSKSSSPAHNKETNNFKPVYNNLPQTYTNLSPTPHSVYYQSYQPSSINTANNITPSTYNQQTQTKSSINSDNSRLKMSNVQKIEVGHPIQLRPLSPIGKLGQTNKVYNNNQKFNQFTDTQLPQQRSYSPIRVQFHNSRVN